MTLSLVQHFLCATFSNKTSSTYSAISASNLKQSVEVHLKSLASTVNHCLKESIFPDELKQSKVITVYRNLTLYRKRIIDKWVYYRVYQKSLREREREKDRERERERKRETVIYTQIDNFKENKTWK